ncbi:DNA alkylation repair protein [Niabella ginsengisoli]|uniref:DNA alkylation repair protein n=1 Tax=Niabella ginsengisoli TaxID=522298 RepID=A0ABS9SKM4_9BACT|nr:DNA alkylation repair protein [Niabella ginsengisoli]MCH5598855.1 DNA alkylation repair protein [Niabella ginsengisoli]
MKLSSRAENILAQINTKTKLGDLRKIAKDIKKDHELAMELWSTERFLPRQLAILIMDNKLLSQDLIDKLDKDMQTHPFDERNQLMDWLMANQLTKDKKTITLIQSWKNSPASLQRRTYWYYQARLRWTGQAPPENTPDLLSAIETSITIEEPAVQWAMNFLAGWIGVYEKSIETGVSLLARKRVFIKVKWYQKGVRPITCQSSLQWKVTNEIFNYL